MQLFRKAVVVFLKKYLIITILPKMSTLDHGGDPYIASVVGAGAAHLQHYGGGAGSSSARGIHAAIMGHLRQTGKNRGNCCNIGAEGLYMSIEQIQMAQACAPYRENL